MIRQSYTAVVERNTVWSGPFATEPYEAGWAAEAIFFVRALEAHGVPAGAAARVQISPDGIRWCDEAAGLPLPTEAGAAGFVRVGHFGAWLRLAGELPEGARLTVIVYLVLKS
jgi:hypothetical protein